MSQTRHQNKTAEDIQQLPIIGQQPKSEKEEDFLREICEFEFMNIKEPGLSHRFPYGNSKNHHNFTFFHGKKYKVPRFLAQWIESRATPLYNWLPDGTGGMTKKKTGNDPRFQMRQVFGG